MSTDAAVRFEFRCSSCWQSLHAAVDEAGGTTQCQYCNQQVTIPQATEDRIQRAVDGELEEPACEEGMFVPNEPLSREQINAIATQRASAAAAERSNLESPGGRSAPRIKRLVAVLVDGFFYGIASVCGGLTLAMLAANDLIKIEPPGREPTFDEIPWEAVAIVAFLPLMLAIVNWNMITTQGQTIGKKLLGIRIVDATGDAPGFLRGVFLRNWLRVVLNSVIPFFGLVDILFIAMHPPRCLHDHIAGTFVVDA